MTERFSNPWTRKTLTILLGNMYPSEMADLSRDRQLRNTDIPVWIDETLREKCTLVVARLPRYEQRIQQMYGPLSENPQPITTLADKLTIYHTVRDDWDSLEPCNFTRMHPIRDYYDSQIPDHIKRRIQRANSRNIT